MHLGLIVHQKCSAVFESRGQTDRVTTSTRAGLYHCRWPRLRVTPHASPSWHAAYLVTIQHTII